QAEDGIRGFHVTGVQTCALPIFGEPADQGSGRDAEDVRGGGAAERERGGAPDAGLGDDADGDSGGEGPEPADADADDEPGDQQRSEERRVGKEEASRGWQ